MYLILESSAPPMPKEMTRKPTFKASMKARQSSQYADDDEEDTRNLTGRIRTAAGYEVIFLVKTLIFYNN